METDEELHIARDNARWRLVWYGHDDDDPFVLEASQLNCLAEIVAIDRELHWRSTRGLSRGRVQTGWPPEFVDNLKSRVRLEDEVGRVTILFKRGSTYTARCPFHNGGQERTPSLVIWPDKQRWKCFSIACGLGGDIITFVQAYQRGDFRQTMEYLADRAGVALPTRAPSVALRVQELRNG